jgi:hypothetical protein
MKINGHVKYFACCKELLQKKVLDDVSFVVPENQFWGLLDGMELEKRH